MAALLDYYIHTNLFSIFGCDLCNFCNYLIHYYIIILHLPFMYKERIIL